MSSEIIKQHYLLARKMKRSLTNTLSAVAVTVPFFAKVLDNGQMSIPIHKQVKIKKVSPQKQYTYRHRYGVTSTVECTPSIAITQSSCIYYYRCWEHICSN